MKPGRAWRLRGWLFVAGTAVSLVLYVPLLLLLTPAPLRWRFAASNLWTRWFARFIAASMGIRHRFTGLENLPEGPRVYMAKHQSAWETLVFQTAFPHYVWIIKREALWIPFFGWGLAILRPIAINRRAGHSAVAQILEQGRRRLAQGLGIMIFPEGTRVAPGAYRRYGLSGALLAIDAGVPVVPIAHNAGCFWPPRRMGGFRPGTIEVVVGQPIDPAGLEPEALIGRLKDWMDATADELAERAEIHPNFRQKR